MTDRPWRLARALAILLDQLNKLYPNRSHISDGSIGDAAHAARASDHNPNERGIVTAIDITHDPANGFDAGVFAEALRRSRDRRVKYVIWHRRIFSSDVTPIWTWRPYNGENPHDKHVHVSVWDDERDWSIR